jgi:Tol biopolymer transport system component
MPLRLALVAAVVPILVAACGGSSTAHVLVYENPVSVEGWGWIWRAAPDGSHPHRLVLGYQPAVSPDGQQIAYLHRGRQMIAPRTVTSRESLWLVRSSGGTPTELGGDERWIAILAWSPDSKHLLIADEAGLRNVDTVSGKATLLARTSRKVGIETASFSPDGRSVAFDRSAGSGIDVFVVPSSGGRARRLTHDHSSFEPVWGPSAIAYCHCYGNTRGDIWLMSADGSHKRRLTHTNAAIFPAAWSRDGRRLLADNPATHNGRLWAVDVPSGRAKPLTGWVGDLFPQGLSPDGKTVYAAVGCGGMVSPYGLLETIPFAGGRPTVIVRGPCRGSWSG